ncbi:MAG: homoserine dehydrogenase [Clostridia bacterium]|nr:homoserine dehydrogenase [Clostridia bacterium]
MIYIAVMGHGVVGSGVLEVFYKNHDSIIAKAGEYIDIKYVLDLRDFPGLDYSNKFIKSFEPIVNDPDVKIVVEVMGGLHPAYEYVRRCLLAGKSVVTSNKELVAEYGDELLDIALKNNLNFLFEASVGGGIPIIRPLSQCLSANNIIEVAGILNGTTNFILTKMIREGMGFEQELSLAQQLGYAERNPASDVEGLDACRKICILASLVYGRHVYPKDVHTEGIANVTLEDVRYAAAWGGVIKLIARVKKLDDGRLSAMVSPAFIHKESQLASVDDVFNGIMVRGDATGDVVFYGRGAGKLPTASAVIADVIDAVKHIKARKYLYWHKSEPGYVCDYREVPAVYFVRARVHDRQAAIRAAGRLFGKVRELLLPEGEVNETAFITPELPEGELERALGAFRALDFEVLSRIRVLDY